MSVWDVVTTPEWVANVGLPLLVTVATIGVAVSLVRLQLAHDRDLARAHRRADAAGRLGARLVALHREFEETEFGDAWWGGRGWPGFSEVLDAVDEAEIVLDEQRTFDYVVDLSRAVLHAWQACRRQWRPLLAELDDVIDRTDLAECTAHAVAEWSDRLREVGKQLIRWDGRGEIPVGSFGRFRRVPLPRSEHPKEYRAWSEAVAAEFERLVRAASLDA